MAIKIENKMAYASMNSSIGSEKGVGHALWFSEPSAIFIYIIFGILIFELGMNVSSYQL